MSAIINYDDQALQEKKKRQEEFLEQVESNLKRSEKDIWFIKNEDHPQKESLTSTLPHNLTPNHAHHLTHSRLKSAHK